MPNISSMERTINRNLLKYAAGRAITCSGCDQIMDWTRTVIVTVHIGEQVIASQTVCAVCYDRGKDAAAAALAAKDPEGKHRLEVLDGRHYR